MARNKRILISLVIPVYNEQATVEPFLARAVPALESVRNLLGPSSDYELVFVDDGSTDATPAVLLAARGRNQHIEIVSLSRNFGKDAALTAGLRHARGHAVIPIDVDGQDPPEIIPEMVAQWLAGAMIVDGVRDGRHADGVLKRLTARLFYRVYNIMAERGIRPDVGDFRLLDRQLVDILNSLPERSRFMKGLFSWVGFRHAEVRFARERRSAGNSKWRYWRLWNFALDGLTGSTTAPLRVWTYIGVAVAGLAFCYALFLVGLTLVSGNPTPGYPSLMTAMLFLGGLHLLSVGILGEYVGRIATEVRGRPLFVVRSINGERVKPDALDERWTSQSTREWPPTRESTGGSPDAGRSSKRSSSAR